MVPVVAIWSKHQKRFKNGRVELQHTTIKTKSSIDFLSSAFSLPQNNSRLQGIEEIDCGLAQGSPGVQKSRDAQSFLRYGLYV